MAETIQYYIKKTEGQGELVIQIDVHRNPRDPIGPQPYERINVNLDDQFKKNNINEIDLAYQDYTHYVQYYVITYLVLFSGCIIVQFLLDGSIIVASLWISSYFLLIITFIFFYIVKITKKKEWLLIIQAICIGLSCIMAIAAVAITIIFPVMYNYSSTTQYQTENNDQLVLKEYDYDTCFAFYENLLFDDYQYYYSNQCDTILRIAKPFSIQVNCQALKDSLPQNDYQYFNRFCDSQLGKFGKGYDSDYQFCQDAFVYYSYQTFEQKYGIYCTSILGLNESKILSKQLYWERINYQSGNLCLHEGFYDIKRKHCYPLQYGMMGYAVLSLIINFVLSIVLLIKIYKFMKIVILHPPIEY